jgi:hypothetical protein
VTFTITSVRREGYAPITVNTEMDEDTARRTAEGLAALMSAVTLTRLDEGGAPTVLGRWENGSKRRMTQPQVIEGEVGLPSDYHPRPVDDDGSPVAEALTHLRNAAQEYVDATDGMGEDAADSGKTENVYCMKCHERRDVHGEVETTEAGRRRFIGICPVCEKRVAKFLPSQKLPEPEWTDEDAEDPPGSLHLLQRDDAGRGKVRLFCSCDEWETTVKAGSAAETRAIAAFSEHEAEDAEEEMPEEPAEDAAELSENATEGEDTGEDIPEAQEDAEGEGSDEDAGAAAAAEDLAEAVTEVIVENLPEGATLPEVAEAVSDVAVAFSDDATAAMEEKPVTPRKRGSRKANAKPDGNSRVTDEEIKATQDLPVANCPYCKNNIPVKTGGSTGVQYLMPHPQRDANGKATGGNCTGSHASVKDGVVQ